MDRTWPLDRAKETVLDYVRVKGVAEIPEQKESRRLFHGSHFTTTQLRDMKAKGLSPNTQNHLKRKINGIVGVMERQRRDPKAFPRTPQHEEGAELATMTLNFETDHENFQDKSRAATFHAATDAIGGVELGLKPTKTEGDYDITIEKVDPGDFGYDPRSKEADFSDARQMWTSKWFSIEEAIELVPDKEDELRATAGDDGEDLTTDPAVNRKWFEVDSQGNAKKVLIVDFWYKFRGEWHWMLFTGSAVLKEGVSPFFDENGDQICKFIMFAACRDQDGDAYSFVRDLKGAQHEINAWNIGLIYDILSRRLIIEGEVPENVEEIRREWARKDGTVIIRQGSKVTLDDKSRDIQGALLARQNSQDFIDNVAINPAVVGENKGKQSGRAISLLQQAGLAELGMFIAEHKAWKLRVYRAMWTQIQRYWTAERWVRVTDDEQVAQFIKVNGVGVDPETGIPRLENALGSLDVDIIIDDGPDFVNAMQDVFETLSEMAAGGSPIPPQAIIEVAPLPMKTKKKINEMMQPQQPPPEAQQAIQIELAKGAAEVRETDASTRLKQAQAAKAAADAQAKPQELRIDQAKVVADMHAKSMQARQQPRAQ